MTNKTVIYVSSHWRTCGVVETTTTNIEGVNGYVTYMYKGRAHSTMRRYVFMDKEEAYTDARRRRAELIKKLRAKIDNILALPLGQDTITAKDTKRERQPRSETLQTLRLVRRLTQSGERPTAALVYHNLQTIRPISRAAAYQQLKLLVRAGKLDYDKQNKAYTVTTDGNVMLERWHHDL